MPAYELLEAGSWTGCWLMNSWKQEVGPDAGIWTPGNKKFGWILAYDFLEAGSWPDADIWTPRIRELARMLAYDILNRKLARMPAYELLEAGSWPGCWHINSWNQEVGTEGVPLIWSLSGLCSNLLYIPRNTKADHWACIRPSFTLWGGGEGGV